MEPGESKVSGTFILPPKPEHEELLAELEAAAEAAEATTVRGTDLSPEQAQDILTLHEALRSPVLRDSLLTRTIPEMLAVTLRVRAVTYRDSWKFHSRKASG